MNAKFLGSFGLVSAYDLCGISYTFSVEMFNIEKSLWENKADYPFCDVMLDDYSSVSINDFVLIIGGQCKKSVGTETAREVHSIIVKFQNNLWTQVGNLMIPRRYHRSIVMNDRVYVVGGSGTL